MTPKTAGTGVTSPHLRESGREGSDPIGRADTVFGVKDSLIKRFEQQPAGTPTPDGRDLGGRTWSKVRFDIVLAPSGE